MIDEGGELPALIVDNNVAIKWYMPEEYAEEAMSLFYAGRDGDALLFAPDLIHAEFGNALWSNHYFKGKISWEEALYYWSDFVNAPVLYTFRSEPLVPAALELGTECGLTVYDALYVALAKAQREEEGREGAVLITADQNSILDKLEGTQYQNLAAHIRAVGDFIAVR